MLSILFLTCISASMYSMEEQALIDLESNQEVTESAQQDSLLNKLMVILFSCIPASINNDADENPAMVDSIENFNQLPNELMIYLFVFIPAKKSMKVIFTSLARLALVNKRFKIISEDTLLRDELARRYISFHLKKARKEFLHAIAHKHVEVVASLLKASIDCNNYRTNEFGYADPALLEAAWHGNKGIAELFIDNGADLDAVDGAGETALFAACRKRHKDIVELLLDSGANIDATNMRGETVLLEATHKGDVQIVWHLIDNGANLNIACHLGMTALMVASVNGCKNIAMLLIDNGADIHTVNVKTGDTALSWASHWPTKKKALLRGCSNNMQKR